jgi:hypothetical protein
MLLTLYNLYNQQGNPTYLTGVAPGGAGTQVTATAPSEYYPMVGLPLAEGILREFLDNGNGLTTAATPQGTLVTLSSDTSANTGAGNWDQALPGDIFPKLACGIVNRRSDLTADPGGFGTAFALGPCQALCTTGANAITYGTLLTSDGNGNLTSYNNPSAAPTPTVTQIGTSGTTVWNYGLVAVSANGTYSALGTTAGTTAGNATLSNTNYNQITWTSVGDAVSYIVVRTSAGGTPTAVGVIGQAFAGTQVFNDTGQAIVTGTSATQFFQRTAAPGAPTATTAGTAGTTTYNYKITAILPNGVWSAESATGGTTTGNATLSATNKITVTWTNVTGATLYAVDRTSAAGTPSSTGLIGYATNGTTGLVDTGLVATAFPAAVTTPNPNPPAGTCLAVSLGVLAANTTIATLVPVYFGGLT